MSTCYAKATVVHSIVHKTYLQIVDYYEIILLFNCDKYNVSVQSQRLLLANDFFLLVRVFFEIGNNRHSIFFQIGEIHGKLLPCKWLDMLCWALTLIPFTVTCRVSVVVLPLASLAGGVGFESQQRLGNLLLIRQKLYFLAMNVVES